MLHYPRLSIEPVLKIKFCGSPWVLHLHWCWRLTVDAASSQTVLRAGIEDKNYVAHLEYFICIHVEDWRWMLPHPRLSVEPVLQIKWRGSPWVLHWHQCWRPELDAASSQTVCRVGTEPVHHLTRLATCQAWLTACVIKGCYITSHGSKWPVMIRIVIKRPRAIRLKPETSYVIITPHFWLVPASTHHGFITSNVLLCPRPMLVLWLCCPLMLWGLNGYAWRYVG